MEEREERERTVQPKNYQSVSHNLTILRRNQGNEKLGMKKKEIFEILDLPT